MPPTTLLDTERLSRFIYTKKHIREDNAVHWRAFFSLEENLRMSVQRTSGITAQAIWVIGDAIALTRRQTLKGRADILVLSVRKNKLDIDPDPPPSRHANIINWPPVTEDRMELAMELASSSQGHRR